MIGEPMDEEASYNEIRRICKECERHFNQRMYEIGVKDKNGKIINVDRMRTLFAEKQPYADIWDQLLDRSGLQLNFSHKNFSNLKFILWGGGHEGITWNCQYCDFSKSSWNPNFDFTHSIFSQCNFSDCHILLPFLQESVFSECDFTNSSLSSFIDGTFKKCNFSDAKIHDLGFKGLNFSECNMQKCTISFDKNWSNKKEIMSGLDQIFSKEQISSMTIKFPSFFSKFF